MFQTFDVQTSPDQGPPRLAALREKMGDLDAYLVPRADVYQGEYVAPCDERLAWLTGFTGSAGFCVVLKNKAGVFIDGRYRLQVKDQVAADFIPVHWPETQLADWLKEQLPRGGKIGFDPWLHTVAELRGLKTSLRQHGFDFEPQDNLIDQIWQDRPAQPDAAFTVHPDDLAGESHHAKRKRLSKDIDDGCQIITQPDSIAWLLNIRGTDIDRNPVPHAFAVLHADASVDLYARPGKADALKDHLGPDIRIKPQDAFLADLLKLPNPIRIDPKTCPGRIMREFRIKGLTSTDAQDPCLIPKACKNETEIEGTRQAHLRDATAMVRFLAWLSREGPSGKLTEIDVVTKLEGFRRDTNQLLDISFETISGAGPNGAIVHYRVSNDTNRPVNPGELLLVDSGGQYADGTTDITRTIAIGNVGTEEKRCYTLVLQGMILSNEPGYYRAGAFGIRIENLIVATKAPDIKGSDDREMLSFETLTWVPLDRNLIETYRLTGAERAWINQYHAQTLAFVGPNLDGADFDWLKAACAPL